MKISFWPRFANDCYDRIFLFFPTLSSSSRQIQTAGRVFSHPGFFNSCEPTLISTRKPVHTATQCMKPISVFKHKPIGNPLSNAERTALEKTPRNRGAMP
jgi:hypothetical protein